MPKTVLVTYPYSEAHVEMDVMDSEQFYRSVLQAFLMLYFFWFALSMFHRCHFELFVIHCSLHFNLTTFFFRS
jgi:hypothetical protein